MPSNNQSVTVSQSLDLLHNLDHILVVKNVFDAHLLRLMLHGRTPNQRTKKVNKMSKLE